MARLGSTYGDLSGKLSTGSVQPNNLKKRFVVRDLCRRDLV